MSDVQCGWCERKEEWPPHAGWSPIMMIRIEGASHTEDWHPQMPWAQRMFGEGPHRIGDYPLYAFVCRACFGRVFRGCSYIDVPAVTGYIDVAAVTGNPEPGEDG